MLEYSQIRLRKTTHLLVGFFVVVFGVWLVAGQFTAAAQKGKDAVKQIEVKQMEKALALYDLSRNALPKNLNTPDWCEIGARYGDRVCLYELTRDGYLPVLPVSPDGYPYLYKIEGVHAYIAVVIDHDLNTLKRETCEVEGVDMWCIKVQRL